MNASALFGTVRFDELTKERQEAFRDLLDDPSPSVRSALLAEFTRLGPPAIAFLESLVADSNRIAARHAQRALNELQNANPSEEFRRFIRSLNYELETGTIMLCRVAYPEVEAIDICSQIDAIANRCRELLVKPSSAKERCNIINRVLFHELGFRGNADDYENPENSFLNRVLETKKGIPISLSILYLLVANRLGAELDPIAYPGHFLVGSFEESVPFYVDPFRRGKLISPNQLLDYSSGYLSISQLGNLAPAPIREVLSRSCRNLVSHYAASGQEAMSRLFSSFVSEFDKSYSNQSSK